MSEVQAPPPAPPPPPPPWPDLFNAGLDTLAATLATISGLRVVMNPKDINPPCVFINAPTIDAFNYNIARMEVPVDVITLGPASLDALRDVLAIVAQLMKKNVAMTDARPAIFEVGSQSYASYRVTIPMQVQDS
jgi:hypothetical protein